LADRFQDDNLYIGTSASEILHFVSLPIEPSDYSSEPTFIEASRLQPAGHGNDGPPPETRGVQSITILAGASRACVLCNGTVSFYTLPELSPAPNGREVQGCQFVGSLDLNHDEASHDAQDIMVANARRITIVSVGEKIQGLKNIQFPGCLKSVRRETIACVADSEKYALLDVEHQQQIPLFPISSQNEERANVGHIEDLPVQETSLTPRSSSLAPAVHAAGDTSGHSRSSSLSNFVSGLGNRRNSPGADTSARKRLASPDPYLRNRSPAQAPSEIGNSSLDSVPQRPLDQAATSSPPAPSTATAELQSRAIRLKPHVLSLTPNEFLLTTGTTESEPGVGMFVNLEGDVVRGTIEFERYPESIVVDRSMQNSESSAAQEQAASSLCVIMTSNGMDGCWKRMQVLSLTSEPGDMIKSKDWISLPEESLPIDVHGTASMITHSLHEVADLLRLVRVRPPEQSEQGRGPASRPSHREKSAPEWEVKRNAEEAAFAQKLSKAKSQVVVWSRRNLYCLSVNPLILQLEARLHSFESLSEEDLINDMFEDLRERDAHTETDFLSFNYVRQKAGLLIFTKLISSDMTEPAAGTIKMTENVLIESGLDPRIVMLLLPMLKDDVLQGPQGIWLSAGLASLVEATFGSGPQSIQDVPVECWQMVKRYLATWQGKRGFGSISDEQYVFDSIDAALLHVLLHLEKSLPRGSPAALSIRAKLNHVVDNWKGDFDRAVALLDEYRRLFALSRLYQSRRLAKDVLATWRRVGDGEADGVGELSPESAEMQTRRYLVNIRDAALVQEYTVWLAQKNPNLAVEVLTDDKSRVKLPPPQVLQLLKKDAPGAVQNYLEYLVFKKSSTTYTDDLIGYYLDSVLSVLESSEAARESLARSYSTYRALEPPKPTYINFIHENAPSEPWWQFRLRLLQLLGGGNYASTPATSGMELTYSIPNVLARLAPFSHYLVSESIILDARQGRHPEALRLLTHGLGDYDTAVRYCYFGGPQSSTSFPIDKSQLPSFDAQKDLFNALLDEFLSIADLSTRLERSSELLARFAKWFDPISVFSRVPEDWSLDLLSEFLLRTMRASRSEMLEASVVKALSAAENLRKQAELVEVCEWMGARVEAEKAIGNGEIEAVGGHVRAG
jgi:vacuolar protein sorting-associated protein 3